MNNLTYNELNKRLIEHYNCFNTERFYLDEYKPNEGFVSIVTSSIEDTCPIKLCRGIARFIKKNVPNLGDFVYVGAWAFKTGEL